MRWKTRRRSSTGKQKCRWSSRMRCRSPSRRRVTLSGRRRASPSARSRVSEVSLAPVSQISFEQVSSLVVNAPRIQLSRPDFASFRFFSSRDATVVMLQDCKSPRWCASTSTWSRRCRRSTAAVSRAPTSTCRRATTTPARRAGTSRTLAAVPVSAAEAYRDGRTDGG